MKPNDFIDPHFSTVSWYRRPQPYVRWLLILTVVAGAVALIPDKTARAPRVFAQDVVPAPGPVPVPLVALRDQPKPAAPVMPTAPEPSDRFVVNAGESIDPEMVHPAPQGIDEAMVVRRPDRRALPRVVIAPPRDKTGELPLPLLPKSDAPAAKIAPKASPNPPATAKPLSGSRRQRGKIEVWRNVPQHKLPAQAGK
jgi:hypothetical protein